MVREIRYLRRTGDERRTTTMKLLFMDRRDVHNRWGDVRFGATPLRKIADCESPGFHVALCLPLADGSYDIFGYQTGKMTPWKLLRSTTRDGIHYENTRVVIERTDSKWQHVASVTYAPELRRYLCMKNVGVDQGFSMYVFTSEDGDHWEEYAGNPVFMEGDRWGTVWSSAIQKFLCFQKGLQRCEPKRYQELMRDARRVLTIRASSDGFRWEPDVASAYQQGSERVDGRLVRVGGPLVPVEYQILPDELDPPDLEFYAGTPFEYAGRYYLQMLNYAGSYIPAGMAPVNKNGHGQSLDTEWWISRDGVHWDRPFRNTRAGEVFILHNPMAIGGQMLFRSADALWGMPLDRITYVTARANGIFETMLFPLPGVPLKLNAKIPGEQYNIWPDQAYIMAELIDDCDRVIPGYDRESCIFQAPLDSLAQELSWNGKTAVELREQKVRVRFYLRAANIYAVTA
jgi:hypothetical protein